MIFSSCKKTSFLVQVLQDLKQDLASVARKILARLAYFLQDSFYWVALSRVQNPFLMRAVRKWSDHTIGTNEKIRKLVHFRKYLFENCSYRLILLPRNYPLYAMLALCMHMFDAFPKLCRHNCRGLIQR